MNIQGLFPLWLTDLISLLSKGLSRVYICMHIIYTGAHTHTHTHTHIYTHTISSPASLELSLRVIWEAVFWVIICYKALNKTRLIALMLCMFLVDIYCKMISRIRLVNTLHYLCLCMWVCVVRTFKIYSLSNFQMYNTILLTIVTILCIRSPKVTYNRVCALRPNPSSWQPPF